MDRREFHKWMGLAGVGTLLPSGLQVLGAEEECGNLREFEKTIVWESEAINYWIDGYYYENSDFNNRASLSILLKHVQRDDSYIDKVLLTTKNKDVVAARYLDKDDKISSGYPPYFVFNNLALDQGPYYLYIQVRKGNEYQRFRFAFTSSRLKRSRLNGTQLPPVLRHELVNSFGGKLSSPFKFRKERDRNIHQVRMEFLKLEKPHFFVMRFHFMHADEDESHYMRYFIVTDPVGRILGLKKRVPGDPNKHFMMVASLSEQERTQWAITKDNVAKINDCPHIMGFCDDGRDALVKRTFRLR